MKVINPIVVTDATLNDHSVPETDYAEWAVGTAYDLGDRVILTSTHKIYESIVDGVGTNTGNDPATTTGYWIEIGATNRWKMFDQSVGSATTTAAGYLVATVKLADADFVDALALLDIKGTKVVVEVLAQSLGSSSVSSSPTTSASPSGGASLSSSTSASPSSSESASVSSSPSSSLSSSPSSSVSSSPSSSPSSSLSASASSSVSPSGGASISSSLSNSPSASVSGSPTTSPSTSLSDSASTSISGSPSESASSSLSPSPSSSASASPYPEGVHWRYEKSLLSEPAETDNDWYQYFFASLGQLDNFVLLDVPVWPDAMLRITLTGEEIELGTFAFGRAMDIGTTLWGLSLGITDYSTKETDEFGVTTVVERVYAKTMECELFLESSRLQGTYKFLASIRATPVVWIGSTAEVYLSTILYGFYKDFDIVLEDYGGCFCSLEIEGLS